MDAHDHLSVMNLEGTICENIFDIDYGGFKDNLEVNESRNLKFDVYRTSSNRFCV